MNSQYQPRISLGSRLVSMLLDHVIMSIIAVVFFIPQMISAFSGFETSHEPMQFNDGTSFYLSLIGLALYFCKDSFNGRSIAKRIFKLQVVDNNTGEAASPLRCLVRNLLCIVWPIEVLVTFGDTGRRLGDRLAGTRVTVYKPEQEQPRFNVFQYLLPLIISFAFIASLAYFMFSFVPLSQSQFSETSRNKNASLSMQQRLNDRFGDVLTADVRVYDTVDRQKFPYVSAILHLKQNFLADESDFKQIGEMVEETIDSGMQGDRYTGQVKYVFRAEGTVQFRTTTIGEPLPARHLRKQ